MIGNHSGSRRPPRGPAVVSVHLTEEPQPRYLLRPVFCYLLAAAAAASLVPVGYWPFATETRLLLGATSVTFVFLAALQLVSVLPVGERGLERWRLGPWFLLWGAASFGVASYTWLGPYVQRAAIQLESVVDALLVVGIAVVVWTAGYLIGPPRVARAGAARGLAFLLRGTVPDVSGGSTAWILYGIGSAAQLLAVGLSGRLGYVGDASRLVSEASGYGQILGVFSAFTLFGVAAAAYRVFSPGTRGGRGTLWVLASIEIALGAIAGSKQSFVLVTLAIILPYSLLRGRLSLRYILVGALIFLWVAVPFNSGYRATVRGAEGPLTPVEAIAATPEVLAATVSTDINDPVLWESTEQMLHRARRVDSLAMIIQRSPDQIPYRDARDFLTAPLYGFIPRAVWPNKPIHTPGYTFNQEYFGAQSHVYSARSITPVGDLYRHGGPLTVVVGMFLLGLAFRLFDSLIRPEQDPRAICFLLTFLPVYAKFEQDVYGMLMSLPVMVLTAVLGARVMCRGAGRSHDELSR